jgi:rhodanese-related sulfurtransferase
MQHNLMLVTLVVASGIMLVWPMISRRFTGINDVGTLEATQLINHQDAVVLDVREDKEYASGRIPRSKHIPLGQVGSRIKELEKFKEKPIVVSCRSGNRSASACAALRKHGFSQVYNLRGGMIAWEQANLPVEK